MSTRPAPANSSTRCWRRGRRSDRQHAPGALDCASISSNVRPVSASLIGLLFIVATLTSRQEDGVSVGVKLFSTPTVFHLSLVLVISALVLAPLSEVYLAPAAITVCAVAGFVHCVSLAVQIRRLPDPSHWSDFWYYGMAPVAAYLALGGVAVATWGGARDARHVPGLVLLALLMLAIRNAWDLITWLAPRRP
jgi:hypothetical protein